MTGAPKLAALDHIARLEPVPRGVYCGAVGWVDADRCQGELNVALRTFWVEDGRLHFGTGGGTWGSTPVGEWDETELKARRLLAVAGGVPVGALTADRPEPCEPITRFGASPHTDASPARRAAADGAESTPGRQGGLDGPVDDAVVWMDGRMVAAGDAVVSVFDHGLTVGDGVFETLKVIGGRAFGVPAPRTAGPVRRRDWPEPAAGRHRVAARRRRGGRRDGADTARLRIHADRRGRPVRLGPRRRAPRPSSSPPRPWPRGPPRPRR